MFSKLVCVSGRRELSLHLSKNEYKNSVSKNRTTVPVKKLTDKPFAMLMSVSLHHTSQGHQDTAAFCTEQAGSQQGRKGRADPSGCALGQRPFSAIHPQQLTHGKPAPQGSTSCAHRAMLTGPQHVQAGGGCEDHRWALCWGCSGSVGRSHGVPVCGKSCTAEPIHLLNGNKRNGF